MYLPYGRNWKSVIPLGPFLALVSSTGQRPEGLMRWRTVRRPSVRPSVRRPSVRPSVSNISSETTRRISTKLYQVIALMSGTKNVFFIPVVRTIWPPLLKIAQTYYGLLLFNYWADLAEILYISKA